MIIWNLSVSVRRFYDQAVSMTDWKLSSLYIKENPVLPDLPILAEDFRAKTSRLVVRP